MKRHSKQNLSYCLLPLLLCTQITLAAPVGWVVRWQEMLKVKVNLYLSTPCERAYDEAITHLQSYILTSAIDGGRWSASRPSYFTPWEEIPNTQWIGSWVGFRFGLDAVHKRKIAYHAANQTAILQLSNMLCNHCTDYHVGEVNSFIHGIYQRHWFSTS
jgi:hypothetical protein